MFRLFGNTFWLWWAGAIVLVLRWHHVMTVRRQPRAINRSAEDSTQEVWPARGNAALSTLQTGIGSLAREMRVKQPLPSTENSTT